MIHNIKIVFISIFLFANVFSNELQIGNRVYKLENNLWYNYSSGVKGDQMIMNRMIVRKSNKTAISENDLLEIGISNIIINSTPYSGGYYLIEIDEDENPISVATSIYESNTFDYIEFDAVCKYFTSPNDYYFNNQWALLEDKLQLELAWEITTGDSNITVGIIDSGVEYNHPDLISNLWENLGEDVDGDGLVYEIVDGIIQFDPDDINGLDDDENDLPDDFIGWDFRNNEEIIPNNEPLDEHGHGTMVSGIISAKTNNYNGIAGIAGGWGDTKQGIKIMPLRRNNTSQFDLVSSSLDCIKYAINKNADIINMSWGWQDSYNYVEETITLASLDSNCVLVAASGNLGTNSIAYPAKYENVLAVGASDTADNWLSFSNYGPELSVVAPGISIPTTTINGGYTHNFNQTSASAPHVTGVSALIRSVNSDVTALTVKKIVEFSADKVLSMNGQYYHFKYGYGRVNAYQAVLMAQYMAENNILKLQTGEVSTEIQENTLFVGEVSFVNDVNVENDVELHFYPGTSITISPTVDLNIEGSLVALGTTDDPISISGGNGIYSQNANVDLSHVSFDNTNLIYLSSSTGVVDNCTFNTNLATVVDGGDFEFNHSTFSGTLAGLVTASMPTEPRFSVELNNCTFENSSIGLATTYRAITTIKNCEFINNETGIFSDSFSEPWLFQENEIYSCEGNNNTIVDNDIGFGVYQDSQPWLGIYWDLAKYFEGHNRIDNTTDIQNASWHQRPIYAQVNNWNSGTNCYPSSPNNPSGGPVISSPTVYDVYYEGPITWEDYIVLRLEAGGEYSEASAIYQQIIENNPNSPYALWALAGLARCMEKNGQLHDLIELLEYYVIIYYGSQIEKYARSYGITSQIVKGDYDKAATMIASFESDYPGSEFEPKIRYESTILYKILQGSSNGRTLDNMSEKIQAEYHLLSANHPETGLGLLATILLGEEQTTSSTLAEVPDSYSLVQVYPNPFNPITNITYDIPEDSFVSIVVYDLAGRKVDDLVSGIVQSGRNNITWNADQFSSGVYFVTMTAPSFTSTQKLVLLK